MADNPIVLTRFSYDPEFTMGTIAIQGLLLYTIEQPWRGNTPGHSCVPEGLYQLVPHDSPDHPDTWALVNHALGVSHYPTPGVPRSEVVIHSSNWAHELRGCIAPGLARGPIQASAYPLEMAVHSSKAALGFLLAFIKTLAQPRLLITQAPGAVLH